MPDAASPRSENGLCFARVGDASGGEAICQQLVFQIFDDPGDPLACRRVTGISNGDGSMPRDEAYSLAGAASATSSKATHSTQNQLNLPDMADELSCYGRCAV